MYYIHYQNISYMKKSYSTLHDIYCIISYTIFCSNTSLGIVGICWNVCRLPGGTHKELILNVPKLPKLLIPFKAGDPTPHLL